MSHDACTDSRCLWLTHIDAGVVVVINARRRDASGAALVAYRVAWTILVAA
jgi:hypothetical protein